MRFAAVIATIVALFVALPAAAQDTDKLKAELKKRVPEMPVDSVRKVPYGGLYEVLVNGEIFYTDEKAGFLLVGPLVDLKTKENVTETRLRQVNKVNFNDLPFDRAIKIVRGDGSRKVAIFEDPNCAYCKRFERDLQGISDITVYVFLYPILSADSVEKAKAIWCSPNPGKVWIDTMTKEIVPTGDKSCPTPLDKNVALGKEKRIQGTPTIIFEDGDRIPGAISMADFVKKLDAVKNGGKAPAKVSSR